MCRAIIKNNYNNNYFYSRMHNVTIMPILNMDMI